MLKTDLGSKMIQLLHHLSHTLFKNQMKSMEEFQNIFQMGQNMKLCLMMS